MYAKCIDKHLLLYYYYVVKKNYNVFRVVLSFKPLNKCNK